ncbi:MAG: 3-hydroxyacyl-CoA dehydrogenase NAD-binding domain-containing protein [Solirubrobacteraceae bacterium]
MAAAPGRIGVLGAGTMGSGIAQAAALLGARVLLHDPVAAALDHGLSVARSNLERGARSGRWSTGEAAAAGERLSPAAALEELAPCNLIIEAAPESLELKAELFTRAAAVIRDDCVLATNTSSLSVTAIAAAVPRPERVVGMHFFNPAPLMPLVEVVAGAESAEAALAVAHATGEAMGKEVIRAADVTGFLVNRCNRPFGLEALRLLEERLASVEQIDRIVRSAGGFRMGPFELMDLVGVDVGLEIARSFWEQSFGEPRWRPSPIAARTVAAGRLGRKSGRGYYAYGEKPHRPDDPAPPVSGGGDGRLVVIAGEAAVADELRGLAAGAGWDALEPEEAEGEVPALILDCGAALDGPALQGGPQAILCAAGSLAALDPAGSAVGFHALPPLAESASVELTRGPGSSPAAVRAVEDFFASLGKHVEWVGDAPGLMLGRIVAQVINEAAFALGEGVGSADDIDKGMRLGLGYPRGPLEWADAIGLDHVLAVLDALNEEYREERYRAAPELRRLVAAGRLGAATGGGFR